jgi:hypothetical protein
MAILQSKASQELQKWRDFRREKYTLFNLMLYRFVYHILHQLLEYEIYTPTSSDPHVVYILMNWLSSRASVRPFLPSSSLWLLSNHVPKS